MTESEDPFALAGRPAAAVPFESLAALRLAHQDLLERQSGSDTAPPETIPPQEISACLDRAQATGAILEDPEDRRIAQRILDYWSADLVAASRAAPVELGPVQLAPYIPPAAPAPAPGDGGSAFQRPEDARQYIRLSALARQWRDCEARGDSSARGYLLTGDALRDAERFERDPDVAALVVASREAERAAIRQRVRNKNLLIAVMALAIVLLAALSGLSYWQWKRAEAGWAAEAKQRDEAEKAWRQALAARDAAAVARTAAEEARAAVERLKLQQAEEEGAQARAAEARARREALAATAALEESRRLADRLRDTIAANTARLAAERGRQQALDAAADILAAQIAAGSLDYEGVGDPALRDLLLPRLSSDINIAGLQYPDVTDPGEPAAAGAEPPAERLPPPEAGSTASGAGAEAQRPGTARPAEAEKPGEALHVPSLRGYDPGFLGLALPLPSLTEQQARDAWQGGAPIPYHQFSIVLDTRRGLPILSATNLDRLASRILPQAPDPIPRPDPRLPDEAQAGAALFEGINLLRGRLVDGHDISWGAALPASDVAAAEFVAQVTSLYPNLVPKAAADRGAWTAVSDWIRQQHNPAASRVTILAGPVFAGNAAVPAAYWKIAVSAQPAPYKEPSQAQLVVDAFLIPNDASPLRAAANRNAESFRTTLDQIVVRTGLSFPPAIVAATRSGERLAARLADLGAPSEAARKPLVQEVLTLLRSPTADAADQRTVCAALLDMAGNDAVARLSPQGRVNLFFLLAQVPAATWAREAWLPLTATARRAAADLQVDLGPEARAHFDTLRASIGLAAPPEQTVYLQFAGLTREDAAALGARLRSLGWDVPGEERVSAEVNQVRYNPSVPADTAAARLLAADLDAAGFAGVEPVAFDIVKPGVIEVWISR